MRSIRSLATIFLCVVAGAVGILLLLPSDIVTYHYATISEARNKNNHVGGGWLPDILPPSTNTIRTSNNLDINTSEGEFSFMPSEYPLLAARVQPYKTIHAPFASFEKDVIRMQSKGFLLSTYAEDNSIWVFFCKPEKGYCEYTMWLRRG